MSAEHAAHAPAAVAAPGAVLIVEDDNVNRTLLTRQVEQMGRRAIVADPGPPDLDILRSEKVDLVLLNVVSPETDGCEVLARIKASGELRHIPVIVVSGLGEAETAARCIEVGAEDYLIKPINPLLLRARITASLEKKRLRDQEADRLRQLLDLQRDLDRRNRELEELNRRLAEAARTDPLTGLPNRRWALEELQRVWQAATRYDRPMACLLVDVVHFKRVNDSFGHDTGDEVLKGVAGRLRSAARQHEAVCRLGGEEFLVVCDTIDRAGAAACAERLRNAVADRPVTYQGREVAVTVSIGAAVRDASMENPEQLLKVADQAVYAAKQSGRNRVVVALAG
jgi:two-component system, cell cycle response regulator